MDRSALFHGIAVVIDDEIDDPSTHVGKLRESINEAGCHVVPLKALPTIESVENLREVAFVVLDWNLKGRELTENGVQLPESLRKQYEDELIEFLKKLRKTRFAPVFIFTDEDVEKIQEILEKHTDLYDANDPSHILVKGKADVLTRGVFTVLDEWLNVAPSVFVLKSWERQYEKAKNELFLDFYTKSTIWPLILWECFEKDSISPSAALAEIIAGNIASRTAPFECDLEPFRSQIDQLDAEAHKNAILKVLEGERFLANNRLDPNSCQPGDIFKMSGGKFYINIRPICDCIPREGQTLDQLEIYVLEGSKATNAGLARDFNEDYGQIIERDTQSIVFPVVDGKALVFNFKELHVKTWADVKSNRVGRLLPPVLTKLQQRYASYLQRPGLTRLPKVAIPPVPPGNTEKDTSGDSSSDEGGDLCSSNPPGCLIRLPKISWKINSSKS